MQTACKPPAIAEQMTLCIWETDVKQAGEGRAVLTARKPLSRLSTAQAAKILGCTQWTVRKLFREGLLTGWKPGAARERSDGQTSNAALVLDAESVLKYKAKVTQVGIY
jgi:excisionase family DNA binding protein